MAKMMKKSFDAPEETRPINKGKVEVVELGGVQAMRDARPLSRDGAGRNVSNR
jgi:hypothetical protein